MRVMTWIGLAAVALLVYACFTPWIIIESRNIVVTGIDSAGTNYGKPAYFNLVLAAFFTIFTLIPRVWAKRVNLLIVALNIAWTVRNFFILSTCAAGECPVRKQGLYLTLVASTLMLVSAVFPKVRMPAQTGDVENLKDGS